jgi:peptidylprolyl isomerase
MTIPSLQSRYDWSFMNSSGWIGSAVTLALVVGCSAGAARPASVTSRAVSAPVQSLAEVLAASTAADWRVPDPEYTLYLELGSTPAAGQRVVMELAPEFAPSHVHNVQALAREGYFDGLAIVRVQENYVVQWGDPEAIKEIRSAARTLPAEFERSAAGLDFTPLPDPDTYAPEVGFSGGFPMARESAGGQAWLVHCYRMLGAGRDNAADSGGGAELYVVIGQAPRQLDRNVTLLGRVLWGMELLTTLPRGGAALGFYEHPEQRIPIRSLRVAADVPVAERTQLEVLRTDTATFRAVIESRRQRREEWFKRAAGRIDVCNVPVVVRQKA